MRSGSELWEICWRYACDLFADWLGNCFEVGLLLFSGWPVNRLAIASYLFSDWPCAFGLKCMQDLCETRLRFMREPRQRYLKYVVVVVEIGSQLSRLVSEFH